MSAHTPGPWFLSEPSKNGYRFIDSENWYRLARVVTRMVDDEHESGRGLANAHLIAAAPDLLAQLGDLVEIVEAAIAAGDWKVDGCCDPDLTLQKARVLLAKLEGWE